MNRAILLTGFNNWGKTSHIYSIFRRRRFDSGRLYSIPGVNAKFTVESHSNDDYNEDRFVDAIKKKMQLAPGDSKDLFCAFCPSREPNNDSQRILQNNPFTKFDEIHVLLLKHKWDFHAELRATEIKRNRPLATPCRQLMNRIRPLVATDAAAGSGYRDPLSSAVA